MAHTTFPHEPGTRLSMFFTPDQVAVLKESLATILSVKDEAERRLDKATEDVKRYSAEIKSLKESLPELRAAKLAASKACPSTRPDFQVILLRHPSKDLPFFLKNNRIRDPALFALVKDIVDTRKAVRKASTRLSSLIEKKLPEAKARVEKLTTTLQNANAEEAACRKTMASGPNFVEVQAVSCGMEVFKMGGL